MSFIKSWGKLCLLSVVGFCGLSASARAAHAEYLCSASLNLGVSTYGLDGHIQFVTYTGPSCTGTMIRQYFFCTGSASHASCASSANYRYDRPSLLTLFDVLQRATDANQNVTIPTVTCVNGTTTCAGALTVRAD